jgi:hypothetical protein
LYRRSCCYRAALWPTILSARPALLTATRWKFMEHTSDYRASTRRRAASYAVARTALNIAVAPRRQTTSALTLRGAPSTVSRSASTRMAAPLRPVQSTAPISANGSCAMALLWIGFNTRKADITGLSAMPSVPVEVSGRAATSSRGSIVPASARAESPPTVRTTTQVPILDGTNNARRQSTTCDGRFPQSCRWL